MILGWITTRDVIAYAPATVSIRSCGGPENTLSRLGRRRSAVCERTARRRFTAEEVEEKVKRAAAALMR